MSESKRIFFSDVFPYAIFCFNGNRYPIRWSSVYLNCLSWGGVHNSRFWFYDTHFKSHRSFDVALFCLHSCQLRGERGRFVEFWGELRGNALDSCKYEEDTSPRWSCCPLSYLPLSGTCSIGVFSCPGKEEEELLNRRDLASRWTDLVGGKGHVCRPLWFLLPTPLDIPTLLEYCWIEGNSLTLYSQIPQKCDFGADYW